VWRLARAGEDQLDGQLLTMELTGQGDLAKVLKPDGSFVGGLQTEPVSGTGAAVFDLGEKNNHGMKDVLNLDTSKHGI
jgi:hypothetical protein